jgi:hypothetical protein
MNKSILRVFAASLFLGLASAALADVSLLSFGITNRFINNATVTANMGNVVKVDGQDNAGLMLKMAGDQAGTGVITITFARSPDNSNWETTPRFTMTAAVNGVTPVVAYTNLNTATIGAAGYLKVISMANADASAICTNCSLYLVKKTIKHAP